MTSAEPIPVPYRVAERRPETADTTTLTLEPTGPPIAPPAPGQFTMLWVFGVGEAPISLAGLDGDRLHHTVRAVGPVSRALAEAPVGTPIGVRGPFGRGWPDPDPDGDVLVVAGGLGLAPLRPLIEQLAADGSGAGDRTVLIGARRPDELLYPDDRGRWSATAGLTVRATVDLADERWRGPVGLVTDLLDDGPTLGPDTTAYVCGPEIMMTFVARRLVTAGVDPARIHVSLERNMHCATGHCGHCQLGPLFVCLDGPVRTWADVGPLLAVPGR